MENKLLLSLATSISVHLMHHHARKAKMMMAKKKTKKRKTSAQCLAAKLSICVCRARVGGIIPRFCFCLQSLLFITVDCHRCWQMTFLCIDPFLV